MNHRPRFATRYSTAVCTGLLLLTGCSTTINEGQKPQTSGTGTSVTVPTSPTAPTTGASGTSTTGSATPNASKAGFCRDVNTAVNIFESPGTDLSAAQTTEMANALKSASNQAPADVPPDFSAIITSMLAALQSSGDTLPPTFSDNGRTLADYAASYCSQ